MAVTQLSHVNHISVTCPSHVPTHKSVGIFNVVSVYIPRPSSFYV